MQIEIFSACLGMRELGLGTGWLGGRGLWETLGPHRGFEFYIV